MVLKFKGLITKLENSNDQIENSHLNWENIAVSEKNYSLPSSSETVSAVKALKLFQLWGTSHGYYSSPLWCMPLPSFNRALSGLMKARERPWTKKEERGRKHEEMVERQGEQKKKKNRETTDRKTSRERKKDYTGRHTETGDERTNEREK